ncbi:MAG: hypothetical protein NZ807_13060, partial [Dehalococcoidia bacterium]|nr:hypothetical protein [Dehalococcoidia bacterium]
MSITCSAGSPSIATSGAQFPASISHVVGMHYFFSLFCKDGRIKRSGASLEDQLYCFAVNISQGR